MGFCRFFVVGAALYPVALAASCAPVDIVTTLPGSSSTVTAGAGGSLGFTSAAAAGVGGAAGALDAGAADGDLPAVLSTSYVNLCGGSESTCTWVPSDSCVAEEPVDGGAGDASVLSCELVPTDGGVVATCSAPGASGDGDPCKTAADCQAGLGCIQVGVFGICRAYCCGSLEACRPDTYCTPQPMEEAPTSAIPVCTPVYPCELLDDATCPAGETCTIVRAVGTTSCVAPGKGTAHDPCPCAAGFTCSWSEGVCLQLCDTSDPSVCGTNAYCQGGTEPYPTGIGYCVSY